MGGYSPQQEHAIVQQAAGKYGIDPATLWGVYGTETSFGHDLSTSSAGAEGPFQFEPGTARSLGVNPHDFRSSAFGAAKYLSQFKGRGLAGMLSAYNAGPAGGLQPAYVSSVERNARSWKGLPRTAAAAVLGAQSLQGAQQQSQPEGSSGAQSLDLAALLQQLGGQQQGSSLSVEGVPVPTAQGSGEPGAPRVPRAIEQAPQAGPASLLSLIDQIGQDAGSVPAASAGAQGGPVEGSPAAGAALHGALRGILPQGAKLVVNRTDKGKDVLTNPGGALLAPGRGEVVDVPSDPTGFGPAYPVIRWQTGPLAGHTTYFGHVDTAVHQGQHVQAGQVIAHTSRTGHNAPPGWVEIGLWGPSGPLQQGGDAEGAAGRTIARLLGVG